MFESIVVRPDAKGPNDPVLDLGLLFEVMLFYGSTKLIADKRVLDYLLATLGPEALVELSSERLLTLYYTESTAIVISQTDSLGRTFHRPL